MINSESESIFRYTMQRDLKRLQLLEIEANQHIWLISGALKAGSNE